MNYFQAQCRSKKNVATLQEASDDDEFQISFISDDTSPRVNKARHYMSTNGKKRTLYVSKWTQAQNVTFYR